MNDDKYDMPEGEGMEPVDENFDAFANVGQGLVGPHKTAMLQYWQQSIDDIERINDDGTETDVFKSTVLPLARIKKVMKTDLDVKMISAEAPILFAKGCDIFITELTMRAWIHAEENKRRTLQRSDIATAIQKSDVFDFLIDIIPREEAQPRRSHRSHDHQTLAEFPSPHGSINGSENLDMDQKAMMNQMPNISNQISGPMSNSMPNSMSGQMPGQMPSSLGGVMGAPGNMIPNPESYNTNLSMMQLNLNHLNSPLPHQGSPAMANSAMPPHMGADALYGAPMGNQDLHNQNLHNHRIGANPAGAAPSNRGLLHSHRSLDNLTNAANMGLDMNAMLNSGMENQLPDMNYTSMDAYLNPPPTKPKDSESVEIEDKSNEALRSDPNFPKIKDENASDHAQYTNDMPFGYAEPVDVSHYEQNI